MPDALGRPSIQDAISSQRQRTARWLTRKGSGKSPRRIARYSELVESPVIRSTSGATAAAGLAVLVRRVSWAAASQQQYDTARPRTTFGDLSERNCDVAAVSGCRGRVAPVVAGDAGADGARCGIGFTRLHSNAAAHGAWSLRHGSRAIRCRPLWTRRPLRRLGLSPRRARFATNSRCSRHPPSLPVRGHSGARPPASSRFCRPAAVRRCGLADRRDHITACRRGD